MINRGVVRCQIELKPAERSRRATDKPKGAGKATDLSARSKRESRRIFSRGLSGQQDFLIGDVRWGRLVRGKCKLEVVNDAIDCGEISEESNDPHHAAAFGTEERVNFINFPDHLGPTIGREAPELILNNPERESLEARLLDLPPMGIGVKAIKTHRDLALVGNMGGDPSDELQVVHRLLLFV
jgi:hypothetical protein